MIKQAYAQGYMQAMLDLGITPEDLEKNAFLKKKLIPYAIAAMLAGPMAHIGANIGSATFHMPEAYSNFSRVMDVAEKAPVSSLIQKYAPNVKHLTYEQALDPMTEVVAKDSLLPESLIRNAQSNILSAYKNMKSPLFNNKIPAVIGEGTINPSAFLHEIGHQKQAPEILEKAPVTVWNSVTGNTLDAEIDAWNKAKQIYGEKVIDPRVEEAALNTYRANQRGAREGAAAGAAGATLPVFTDLIRRLQRLRNNKSVPTSMEAAMEAPIHQERIISPNTNKTLKNINYNIKEPKK